MSWRRFGITLSNIDNVSSDSSPYELSQRPLRCRPCLSSSQNHSPKPKASQVSIIDCVFVFRSVWLSRKWSMQREKTNLKRIKKFSCWISRVSWQPDTTDFEMLLVLFLFSLIWMLRVLLLCNLLTIFFLLVFWNCDI